MISLKLLFVCATIASPNMGGVLENQPVENFREYIKIDTSKDENIEKAVEFWKALAKEINLPIAVHRPAGKPIVVITWAGEDPTLPSIMLNSHMDVVPADENEWIYPPFSAHIDSDRNIFGRGTQDTKDIAIQYFEAIRRLNINNETLLRTVHMTLMPDEETGGYKGMKEFVKTKEFHALNVAFVLDEGSASDNKTLIVVTEDRRAWQMTFTIFGDSGHGSTMPVNNAVEKANRFMSRVLEFRRKNMKIMKKHHPYDYGKYTSVNINMIHGGNAVNVIPGNVTVSVDMRLTPDSDTTDVYKMVKSWMDEAGNDTQVSFIRREEVSEKTVLDESNLYWMAMKSALDDMNYDVNEIVCPATSDAMVLRNLGFPAVGFAPKTFTTSRIHGKNEYLNIDTLLEGINIYYNVIKNIANVPDHDKKRNDIKISQRASSDNDADCIDSDGTDDSKLASEKKNPFGTNL